MACLLLALPLAGFGYWGLHTVDGNHAFDEMAGIVPFAAEALSVLLVLLAGAAWLFSQRTKKIARVDMISDAVPKHRDKSTAHGG